MSPLYYIAVAMIGGLLLTRVAKKLHLPNVTAFLIAGVLVGPYVLDLVGVEEVRQLDILTEVALGFIAFSIGDEFKIKDIKALGKSIFIITLFQALTAVALVDVFLVVAGFPVPVALALGAIASSTAPAATLSLVRQYHADGPMTRTLLPVVALDDAVGLVVYSISVSVAATLAEGTAFSAFNTLVLPIIDIFFALLIGFVFGFLITLSCRFFHSHANRVCVCIAMVLLGVAIAKQYGLSDLLLCMMTGATYVNLRNDAEVTLKNVDEWTNPVFMLFFILSGAELDLPALTQIGKLGILYVALRFAGKYLGSFIGGKMTKADEHITRYLGLTLMPQAGVAIGMAQLVVTQLPQYGQMIRTVVLAATLVYEFVGPLCAKYALVKAGEIKETGSRLKPSAAHAD